MAFDFLSNYFAHMVILISSIRGYDSTKHYVAYKIVTPTKCIYFFCFLLYPAYSRVAGGPGNLVLKHSVPIEIVPFLNFRRILKVLRVV